MRLALVITMLLISACDGVPFPVAFVSTDIQDVDVSCDPEQLPMIAEEFDVYSTGPVDGSIDPSAYAVRIDYTSSSEAVTLSEPSGGSLPFGNAILAVVVESCEFEEAVIDIDIELSGMRTSGSTFQTGWLGGFTVTNE